MTVLAELDATVSAKLRAQVAQYVAKRDPSITITKAWSDFAMAAFLMGDSRLAAWAGLNAGFADIDGHLSPADFDFVKPGVARSEVDQRLGKPYVSSPSVVVKGQIDLFLDEAPTGESNPKRAPQPTEDVHYYEYRPVKVPSQYARIVFRKDKVWYAMLPPKSIDTSVEKAQARYGKPFVTNKIHKADGHILSVIVVHRIPDLGVGLVEVPGRGITHRLVFPPEKK